jgi:hypothetical protein
MQRLKASPGFPAPQTPGQWLAGVLIGSAIMTMATSAVMFGAGAAIQGATLGRPRPGS